MPFSDFSRKKFLEPIGICIFRRSRYEMNGFSDFRTKKISDRVMVGFFFIKGSGSVSRENF